MKAEIEGRIDAGTASREDLDHFILACRLLKDQACVERAQLLKDQLVEKGWSDLWRDR